MKKRILSLVLCAAMLLSMAVLMGAGTTGDTAADTTESASTPRAVNFTNVAPFVQMNAQVQNGPARALLRASSAPADPPRTEQGALVTTKAATALGNGEYKIKLTSYTTGTVTEQQITKPTDIVLVLDRSGSMQERDMTATNYTAYTNTKNSNLYDHRDNLWYKLGDSYVPANVVSTEKYDYQPCSDKTTNSEHPLCSAQGVFFAPLCAPLVVAVVIFVIMCFYKRNSKNYNYIVSELEQGHDHPNAKYALHSEG